MSAGERLPRLLALVPWLSAHDGITIDEAAAHFGITPEQLTKDLWQLIVCGVPGYGPDQLVDIQFWDDDVIHVLDPQTLAKPMHLTYEEAVPLLVALRVLAQTPGIDDRAAILSAAAKIEQAVASAADPAAVAMEVAVDPQVREAVDAALVSHAGLRIQYTSGTSDEVTERTVLPRGLMVVDGLAYLEAYCTLAEGRRTFRLDRVLSAQPDADAPQPPPDEAPAATAGVPDHRATLTVTPEARWIVDVHGATVVEAAEDGSTRIELPLHSTDWAVRLVLSLRGAAAVEAPDDLREAVAVAAAAALRAYPVA